MTTLGEAPGGAQFIESLTGVVKQLGLLYAHTPDERAQSSLDGYIERIGDAIVEAVGAKTAPKLLEALRCAVMSRKKEIENSPTSRMMQ